VQNLVPHGWWTGQRERERDERQERREREREREIRERREMRDEDRAQVCSHLDVLPADVVCWDEQARDRPAKPRRYVVKPD
jgi:hypothetical protein